LSWLSDFLLCDDVELLFLRVGQAVADENPIANVLVFLSFRIAHGRWPDLAEQRRTAPAKRARTDARIRERVEIRG
jgi:hypothetical protein